jgi:phage replication initiation protein
VRHEVEWHNIDRNIPWEAVLEPGKYVAGAYPALSWVSETAERIKTLQRSDAISYKRLTHHCAIAYGSLVNVMREREGSDAAVLRKLARPGVPRRLEVTQRLGTYERSESEE